MPELALRGERSKVLQERHSEAIQATSVSEKQAPSLRVQNLTSSLLGAPLKTSMSRVIIYSLIIYLFILFVSTRPDMVRLMYFRGPSLRRVGFCESFVLVQLSFPLDL